MTEHKVIFGDSRNLSRIADKSVQLIITSPPYWQLKDYGNDQQIGFNDSYEDYINNLNLVWSECNRVLSDGCKMCVNIGDQCPFKVLWQIQGDTYKDRDNSLLRNPRYGLYGGNNLAENHDYEHFRRRSRHGQLSLSQKRNFEDGL